MTIHFHAVPSLNSSFPNRLIYSLNSVGIVSICGEICLVGQAQDLISHQGYYTLGFLNPSETILCQVIDLPTPELDAWSDRVGSPP